MIVRTVLGDVAPETLGFTLAHEHLIGQPPPEFSDEDLCLTSEADAVAELGNFAAAGGKAVVEMSTADYHRDVTALARVSRASSVHIVAATGFNKGKFADRYASRLTENELADWLVAEVSAGIAEPPPFVQKASRRTSVRAGVLKGSSSLNGPTRAEEKVLRAVAAAHAATGAPVSTHTEKATWAVEQAQFLLRLGVRPDKLLLGHLDFRPDLGFLTELAGLGIYLGLDQFSKDKYLPDATRVELVVRLLAAGHERLLLSGDLARKSYWRRSGGAGFQHLPKTVCQMLKAAGLTSLQLETLFVTNPARWLQFAPAEGAGSA